MMKGYRKALVALAVFAGVATFSGAAEAANWLMLQGTEPGAAAGRAKVWGFLQPTYQNDSSEANKDGAFIPPKLIGPDLTGQDGFNILRARLGARGVGMPLDPAVNYFLLVEFGNNGITGGQSGFAKVTDASVTFNQFKKLARVRVGLFKTPGPEEGLQAIHVFDYINFTTVANQLMLERFPNRHYTPNLPITNPGGRSFDEPVGAFRDTGVQIFNSFVLKESWDVSYAVMYGNGNGLSTGEIDDLKDSYLYLSVEKKMGGQGPRAEGLKVFAWSHSGKRLLDNSDDGEHNPKEFDRTRSGAGFKFMKKPFRLSAEYMQGEGMIFVGPDKPTFKQNDAAPFTSGAESKAAGWYVDAGYYFSGMPLQIDLRYDVYNRLTEGAVHPKNKRSFESEWIQYTIGLQWHFNLKTRATLNYIVREVTSPDWPEGQGPNANMDGIGDRWALQVTHIF